jgi:hypothetical protein
LKKYHALNVEFFKGKELYLLRNQSRGRGIGFFEAGNFHPDFILWLLTSDRQYVSFVDPKGLLHVQGTNDPKIRFHETVKGLEHRLGDARVTLNSFVVSVTPHKQVGWWGGGMSEQGFEEHHVYFRDPETYSHLKMLFQKLSVP